MIQCNHCSKQYIGETKRRLKDRFNEDRRPVDNPSNISKPTTFSEHFRTNDHSTNDITLIPLELIKSNRDSVEKLEKHTSSREIKLLNQKMKYNTVFISSICYHLFILVLYFAKFFQSLLQRFLFSTFTFFLSHLNFCVLL